MTQSQKSDKLVKSVKLNHVYPKDLNSNFVTNMVVQHTPDHFVLSFFEVWPPPLLGDEEDKKEKFESIDNVDAKCVSRLVVTPDKMKEFISVMASNFEKYQANF